MRQVTVKGKTVTLNHDRCMRCGRELFDPASRRRGYGLECMRKMSGHVQMTLVFDDIDISAETDNDGIQQQSGTTASDNDSI